MHSHHILEQRGIRQAAVAARWRFTGDGWHIPLFRADGTAYPKQAWKAQNSHATPKYRIPYKKQECAIYMLPSTLNAIRATGGTLIIAGGFVDNLTFHEAGIRHVISFLGESAIPENLLETLQAWGVTNVRVYPHLDETGRQASQKIKAALHGVIPCTSYELPSGLGQGGDINDLWKFVGFNRELFSGMLAHLPILTIPEQPQQISQPAPATTPIQPSTRYGITALEREADHLAKIKNSRNTELNKASFRVGQIVGAGLLDQFQAEQILQQAALSTGLTLKEIMPTLRSGLQAGIQNPRRVTGKQRITPSTATTPRPTTAPDHALPDNVREKLLHLHYDTSRGKVAGVTIARMLEILLREWQPGQGFTAKEAIQVCEKYSLGRSDVYAILSLSPEKPLFFFGWWQSPRLGDSPRQYRLPGIDHICKWLEIEGDLLIFPLPQQALTSAKAYRQALHEAYLSRKGDTTEPTRKFAERLGVKNSTIWAYEHEMGDALTREARYERVPIKDVRQLPDEATALKDGIFLENGAGVRGRVTARNFHIGMKQTGAVYLCRRLSSRRTYKEVAAPDPAPDPVVYCQFCGQAHHTAFGAPPRECQTCRDLYRKEGRAYWGEKPPPIAPEQLQ